MQVQLATQRTTGQRVALKQVYIKQPARGPSGLIDPAESALREIAALQMINHPHVVTLYDVITKVCRMICSTFRELHWLLWHYSGSQSKRYTGRICHQNTLYSTDLCEQLSPQNIFPNPGSAPCTAVQPASVLHAG